MSQMKAVGVRELKNKLSEYLREVRAGTTVLVTDRGVVIAEIREPSASHPSSPDLTSMDLWIDAGKIRAPLVAKVPVSPTKVRLPDGTVQSILDLERGT